MFLDENTCRLQREHARKSFVKGGRRVEEDGGKHGPTSAVPRQDAPCREGEKKRLRIRQKRSKDLDIKRGIAKASCNANGNNVHDPRDRKLCGNFSSITKSTWGGRSEYRSLHQIERHSRWSQNSPVGSSLPADIQRTLRGSQPFRGPSQGRVLGQELK